MARSDLVGNVAGTFHHVSTNAKNEVTEALAVRGVLVKSVADFAAANTAVSETAIFTARVPCKVRLIQYTTAGANVTANDTNYRTWTFNSYLSNGTAKVTNVAAQTTKATGGAGVTSKVAWNVTLDTNVSNLALNAGETLTFAVASAGSTAALTAGVVAVWVEET